MSSFTILRNELNKINIFTNINNKLIGSTKSFLNNKVPTNEFKRKARIRKL